MHRAVELQTFLDIAGASFWHDSQAQPLVYLHRLSEVLVHPHCALLKRTHHEKEVVFKLEIFDFSSDGSTILRAP